MNFTDEEQILPESLTGKKDMISQKMTEHGMKLKNGMSFYWKNICKQKTAPESEKVDPALKFMLNISLARESVRQAHTLFL